MSFCRRCDVKTTFFVADVDVDVVVDVDAVDLQLRVMKKRLREVVNSGPSFSASSQFRDEASDEKDPDAVATLRWN